MNINILKPRKALNKAFLKVKPNRTEIEHFKANLIQLLDRINDAESEEFHKNLLIDFLKKTYYDPNHFVNTKGRNDLVIHNGDKANSSVGVIVETKKPGNKSEMVTTDKLNAKAFQELVLYYLRERITHKNLEVKHLVITNVNEWFIFDANVFDRLFAQNKNLVKQFNDFEAGRLAGVKTDFFYKEIAEPFIDEINTEIDFTYFHLQEYQKPLRNEDKEDDTKLIALFKLLSPEHLLKLPFANDSNTLDKRFYSEMLHIIGLTETKEGGKKLIGRNKEGERNTGTILEDAIIQLDSLDKISRLEKPSQYGTNYQERLFSVALELSITWMNRILFLKLMEAQLFSYHKDDESYAFLNIDKVKSYDDLNTLFFQVLARKFEDRNSDVVKVFEKVPYLNSSLFEPTDMEHNTIFISNLSDDKPIPIISSTVLKDQNGKRRTGSLGTLEYLFEFLSAYDFSSEGSEKIQEENKTLINASVLGLIFEKINGYKDGSFFTPGFITMYMCHETIRKAVVQKFNETKNWNCQNINDVYNKIEDRNEANEIVNSIKICDPAVGSGHFLVSALNEIISIKNDLKILQDRDGRRLKEYHIEVVNDELTVTDEDGELFEYNPANKESQRIQETLFHEKQSIIENSLFGVDINPNSVKICRLRLWIELLKNAYYKNATELETLPNIDINIKCGNSLVSRFDLDSDLKKALAKSKWTIDGYRIAVATYRNAENKEQKREMERLIANIKSDFRSEISMNDPKLKRLQKLKGEFFNHTQQTTLFERSKKEQDDWNKKAETLSHEIRKLETEIEEIKSNKIFENAFEWRFEFPEVLNEDGDFVGFDVVIGNPPYIKEYEGKEIFDGLRNNEIYQGKMDIWYMFGSDGIKLLKENGYLNFIAPNNWTTNAGASKFRNFLLENIQIEELIDFGSFMVFDTASIQTMIMLFKKEKADKYNFSFKKMIYEKPILDNALNLIHNIQNQTNEFLEPQIENHKYRDKNFTFSSNINDVLLDKIFSKGNFKLDKKHEVAQGIVFPQDFINKKSQIILGDDFNVGDGIFGLSETEKNNLDLSDKELELIKPYFTSEQFFRYYANNQNKLWLIYTSSKFKNPNEILPYPNIKRHLDQFQSVITSDNKPYGLHRTRVEDFFIGEKIIVQRKCPNRPVFTYTDFDTYVSATFYVIKTQRVNQIYLTGLLNSKLIEFWLRNRGKMQGNNYQIDKGPLLDLPLIKPDDNSQHEISDLVSKIIYIKKHTPSADTTALEAEIDQLVYQLYDLTEEEIEIIENA
ncbi:MAG: Eco57I restriction-modification methylase domain-containing protein [Bacteroidales bacterium]|nr:Eco57I restriction-modification methylase domain-containing protein [Bacteroidales bacterium]